MKSVLRVLRAFFALEEHSAVYRSSVLRRGLYIPEGDITPKNAEPGFFGEGC